MDFKSKRVSLLQRAYKNSNNKEFDEQFTFDFFSLIEDVVLYMSSSEDSFFGYFMMNIKRKIRCDIESPIAVIPKRDGFNMYFNPHIFLECTKKEMAALFKHEIYHIMYMHYTRAKKMLQSISKEACEVALDISINQYINNLPLWSRKLNKVEREYNVSLMPDKTAEEYGKIINKSIKLREKSKDYSKDKNNDKKINDFELKDSHKLWEESNLNYDEIRSLIKKTAFSKVIKNIPEGLEEPIKALIYTPEIPWQNVLKMQITKVKSGYKKTTARLNRRQPNRYDLRGNLPEKKSKIAVVIDISASISEDEMKKFLIEIISIVKNNESEITVIECDDKIRSVYKLKDENDIKKRSKNNGSTLYSPVFEYLKENRMKDYLVIYFTDGVSEKKLSIKPVNRKIIWVISGSEEFSLKESYGIVKRINKDKKKVEGSISLEMVNSVIHDWAR
ncbi:VWA-like domain-containing protein [Clostridium sp. BJN0001]|uniref:vWA domain-containing protein n=1 Tax=Clostridium sp. BJN0001 TaxID=2930219 RepID=UPI001FD15E3D|nr:VWA-like domain-containing protein [Clostridium sp. BJN0001]